MPDDDLIAPRARDDARSRWNARYVTRDASGTPPPSHPDAAVTSRAAVLPTSGRALDVAGGTGRHAVWLAQRGFDVTLVDVADAACDEAARHAEAAGVVLTVVRADLAVDAPPPGPFDVVVAHHWLDRRVWAALPALLAPGGVLLLCQPTVTNLDRHARPSRRWLLADGEAVVFAADAVAADPDLEVVEVTEGWTAAGRHEATVVLRRRAGARPTG